VTESDPLLDSGGDSVSVALRKDVEEQTVMDGSESQAVGETMSYREVLSDPSLRKGVVITLFAMLLQQFSGINAIMYFSTSILTPLMPSSAPLISYVLCTPLSVFCSRQGIPVLTHGRSSAFLPLQRPSFARLPPLDLARHPPPPHSW
jgi:hypothetical protein